MDLASIFQAAQPIKGIASFHHICNDGVQLTTKRYTAEGEASNRELDKSATLAREDQEDIPERNLHVNQMAAVKIAGKRKDVVHVYMAQVSIIITAGTQAGDGWVDRS